MKFFQSQLWASMMRPNQETICYEDLPRLPLPKSTRLSLFRYTFAMAPEEALASRDQMLSNHGVDPGSLLEESQDTSLRYGSEFHPLNQLEKVLGSHHL